MRTASGDRVDSSLTWPGDRGGADAARLTLFIFVSVFLHLLFLAVRPDLFLFSAPSAPRLPSLTITLVESPAPPIVETVERPAVPAPEASGVRSGDRPETDLPAERTADPAVPAPREAARTPLLHETPEALVGRHYRPDDDTAKDFGSQLALHLAMNPGMRGLLSGIRMLNEVLPVGESVADARARCLVAPFVFREHIGNLASDSTIRMWNPRCAPKPDPLFQSAGADRAAGE